MECIAVSSPAGNCQKQQVRGLRYSWSDRRDALMRCFRFVAISLLLIYSIAATAKDKKKYLLPTDVLEAKTVLVVVDPNAGIAVNPTNANATFANSKALEDVE